MRTAFLKILIILFLAAINAAGVTAQTFQVINQKTFGGVLTEYVYRGDKLKTGGYVVAARTNSPVSGDLDSAILGIEDYLLVKYDENLSPIWYNTLGGTGIDMLQYVITTSDSGMLCIGSSDSPTSGEKADTSINGSLDYWLIKMDLLGSILWQKTIGGAANEFEGKLEEVSDGYIIGGYSTSDSSYDKTEDSRGLNDYWIVKTDKNGNIQWDRTLGGTDYDNFMSLECVGNHSIYVVGESSSPASFDKTEGSYGWSDGWIVKLDGNGNVVWDKTLGGSSGDNSRDVVFYENYLYVLGSSGSDSSGTKTQDSKGSSDYWVTKMDTLGNIVWDKSYGANAVDMASDIMVTADGELILSGSSSSQDTYDKTEPSNGVLDYWIVAIDTAGNITWQKTIGGNDDDVIANTIEVENNHYVLTGYSRSGISSDKDEFCRGEYDIWVVELTHDVGIPVSHHKATGLRVYPNPASDEIYLQNDFDITDIEILDITGKFLFRCAYNCCMQLVTIPVHELAPGCYFASLYSNQSGLKSGIRFVVAR